MLPLALLDRWREKFAQGHSRCPVPWLSQKVLYLFMSEGYWDRYTRATMTAYHKRRNLLMECLQHEMGDKIEIFGGTAGLHLLVATRDGRRECELLTAAETAGACAYTPPAAIGCRVTKPTLRKMRACGAFRASNPNLIPGRRASPRAGVVPWKNNAANANGSQDRCPSCIFMQRSNPYPRQMRKRPRNDSRLSREGGFCFCSAPCQQGQRFVDGFF